VLLTLHRQLNGSEQPSSKGTAGGWVPIALNRDGDPSNPSRCMWIVRTGSSMAEPPPFKRTGVGSSPARCNETRAPRDLGRFSSPTADRPTLRAVVRRRRRWRLVGIRSETRASGGNSAMEPLEVKFTRPVWESGNGTTRGSFFPPIRNPPVACYGISLSPRRQSRLRRRDISGLE
jgi:hypothetical protein